MSPNADWGYDVADYCAVQPDLGTMASSTSWSPEAGERDIRVLLDIVPNHTSEQHPWFVDSRSSSTAAKRDWYVWADPKPDGAAPNNWVSSFGGPAWTLDPTTGQFYLHNHLSEQPDLNWWNEEVRSEFDSILRFWFDRGVAGFRIDVCNIIIKDAQLRDNPPATEDDDFEAQLFGQRPVYNGNRPEVHDVIRRWRTAGRFLRSASRPHRRDTRSRSTTLVDYYGNGDDELHLAFNFPFITAPFDADAMRQIVEETEALLAPRCMAGVDGVEPRHVAVRLAVGRRRPTQGPGRPPDVALPAGDTAVLYQGDEIGLGDSPVAQEDLRDPLGVRYWPAYAGRDAMRTPMPWRDVPGWGLHRSRHPTLAPSGADRGRATWSSNGPTPGPCSPWLGTSSPCADRPPTLHSGSYETMTAPEGVWAWRRGDDVVVVLNMNDHGVTLQGTRGHIRIGTDRARDGESLDGPLTLRDWEGVVIEVR